MTKEQKFKNSENTVKTLKSRPSNDELLKLYALFKQATHGDVTGSRPSLINVKARAKWDAWKLINGTEKNQAMENYTNIVDELVNRYGVN
jgi:diazepam-binding inhibitor (GABA receptor modulator, acyl-CoA-binding protein)